MASTSSETVVPSGTRLQDDKNPSSTASTDAAAGSSSSPELLRCEDLWLPDGTVVLRTGNTLFRVYFGMLAAHSAVFKDLHTLPQAACRRTEEFYEDAPLIVLHDAVDDLWHFLKVLHNWSYFNTVLAKGEGILGILKLSTKYQVYELREQVINAISCYYPSTLQEWISRPKLTGSLALELIPLNVLNTARDANALVLVPGPLLHICSKPLDTLLTIHRRAVEGKATLTPANLAALVEGRSKIHYLARTLVYKFAFYPEHIAGCESLGACLSAKTNFAIKVEQNGWIDPLLSVGASELGSELCEICIKHAEKQNFKAKAVFWRSLPALFGLADDWMELSKTTKLTDSDIN